MSKISITTFSIFFLGSLVFLIACHKTEGNENPALPFSFYVSNAVDKQPISGVTVTLYKKAQYSGDLFPFYEPGSKIGQTDFGGKLWWDYPRDSLNSRYLLTFEKQGYYNEQIKVSDPPQHEFQIALSKVARVNFHLTYNNDTIPKKFHCYRQFLMPASHYSPGGYGEESFLLTQARTKIDTSFLMDLPLNSSQTLHCYMVDASTVLNPSHNYPSSAKLKTFVLPSNAKDTTIVIEAFWK